MTPPMRDALYRLSLCHDPNPESIFQRIVQTVGDHYGGTMAMINLTEESRIRFRAVVNPHPAMQGMTSLPLKHSFCQYAMGDECPLLIQDAANSPQYTNRLAVRFGLTRYLGVPIHNPAGEPIGTLCFLDDRTEEKLGDADVQFLSLLAMRVSAEIERERMIRERVEEHQAMARELAEANAQLEATAEAKQRFVAMVIHDLRHPLTALKTILYLLRDEGDAEERALHISALENRVGALAHLLDGLRQYNEIEAGRIALKIETVDLHALIEECMMGFAPAVPGDSVRLEREVAADVAMVRTDAEKVKHILLNLLSNAIKFTPKGGIRVRAMRLDAAHWILEVQDTGMGMSADVRERAFDEYFRGEGSGSGLGLAIVKQLCVALGATIEMESAPGSGTRFRLTFPDAPDGITQPELRKRESGGRDQD